MGNKIAFLIHDEKIARFASLDVRDRAQKGFEADLGGNDSMDLSRGKPHGHGKRNERFRGSVVIDSADINFVLDGLTKFFLLIEGTQIGVCINPQTRKPEGLLSRAVSNWDLSDLGIDFHQPQEDLVLL